MPTAGSSPLTRGKRARGLLETLGVGLIPAHAGKTSAGCSRDPYRRAHPRSRGENDAMQFDLEFSAGSSPLTRGKLGTHVLPTRRRGLIPAHAGKTLHLLVSLQMSRAHPRSRGENAVDAAASSSPQGSSPLTRGKRSSGICDQPADGLIPAHAGKTRARLLQPWVAGAHPRSRGENFCELDARA